MHMKSQFMFPAVEESLNHWTTRKVPKVVGTLREESESETQSVMSDSLRPHDYTAHGIFQARIVKRVAFPFSRGLPTPGNRTQVSCTAGGFFTRWASREAHIKGGEI